VPIQDNSEQTVKSSKYRNVITEVDGIKFHSKAEARRWQELKLLERAGAISDLCRQTKWPLYGSQANSAMPVKLKHRYVADFSYFDLQTAKHVVEDVKGFRTPVYILKAALFSINYGFSITEVRVK